MNIKVLGPGCPKCQQTEKIVKEAVAEAGVEATVEKVTDMLKIAEFGVFGTPSVVVDGEVKSVGKIPSNSYLLVGAASSRDRWGSHRGPVGWRIVQQQINSITGGAYASRVL